MSGHDVDLPETERREGPTASRPERRRRAQSATDVVRWVENNQHHWAGWSDDWKTLTLRGHGTVKTRREMVIPETIWKAAKDLIGPSADRFDSRMFRAKPAGLALLGDGDAKEGREDGP